MSSDQQQSSAAVAASLPPSAKRKKPVLYEVGPVEGRDKWYLDAETADVHFVIGSDVSSAATRIPAHKTLLARDSDVFKAMFYGPMKESGDIRLTDVSEAAVREFLQFFYLTEVELTVENLTDVMHLGHKYNVVNCVDVCIKFFKDVHDAGNILIGLGFGILYEHSELVTFCERFIAGDSNSVLKSSGFLECDRQLLAHILNANLFVCSEVALFKACMRWVKAASGHDALTKEIVDEHLSEVFHNIRFGTMTIKEFRLLAKNYDSVLSNDFETITNLIGLPEFQQHKFNTQSRQIKWSDPNDAVLKCDRVENGEFVEWSLANRTECIEFRTTESLLLTGFTINKIVEQNDDDVDDFDEDDDDDNYGYTIPAKVKISEIMFSGDREVVLEMDQKFRYGKSSKIVLPRPIRTFSPYSSYEIAIEFPFQLLGKYIYLSKALKEEVLLDSGAAVEFYECKKSRNGTETVALISELEFNRI